MQSEEQLRSQLANTIQTVSERLGALGGRRSLGEQDTKRKLIEPVLATLGWDLGDLDLVSCEYKHNRKDLPVDYAFFSGGRPVMFLEAKAIGLPIDDHKWMAQIVNYANSAGVEICVLTNGDEYRIFNTHAKVPLQQKQVAAASISQGQAADVLDVLACLALPALLEQRIIRRWEQEQLENSVRQALTELVQSRDRKLVNLLAASLKDKIGVQHLMDLLSRASISVSFTSTQKTQPRPRRAIGGDAAGSKLPTPRVQGPRSAVRPEDLLSAGLLAAPLELTKLYKKRLLKAVLNSDGSVSFGGARHNSLSVAAGYARNSVIGVPADGRLYYETNGWEFWHCQFQGRSVPLSDVRAYYEQSQQPARRSRLHVVGE